MVIEKGEIMFIVCSFVIVGLVYNLFHESNRAGDRLMKETQACEKSGGVYVDNMYRIGKNLSHERMCMNKNLFIFPEGE